MNEQLDTVVRGHHPFSPSTLQAREACPKYQPRGGTNDAAERGTLQHKATELAQDDNALTDEEAAAAAECLDFLEERKHLMKADRKRAVHNLRLGYLAMSVPPRTEDECQARAESDIPQVEELSEVYLPVDDQTISYNKGKEIQFNGTTTGGYIDKALISHDRLYAEIVDWKFGKWEVESADNNLQGISYFLGLLFRISTLKKVRVYFKQPHIDHLTYHDFYAADKPKHLLRVKTVVARAIVAAESSEDFSMANPTVSGCLFCDLIGKCPKVAAIALNIGSKFAPLKIPAEITPSLLRDKHQAALAMKCASVLAVWCAGIKATTSNACISGSMDLPEGYTIASRADRVVTDNAQFKTIALQYLTPEEYDALRDSIPALTKVEGVISDKAPRGSKKGTLEEFNDKLKDANAIGREQPITFLKMASAKKEKQPVD